jgi:hypothetical protein
VSGTAGRDVTVPIALDTAAGLDSVQLRLAFDSHALDLREVRKGDLTVDFDWLVDRSTPGILRVDMARLSSLQGGEGNLLELDFHVHDDVAAGSYRLDLQWVSLNDGRLTLSPAPKAGVDFTDGSIQVQQQASAPIARNGLSAASEMLLAATVLNAAPPMAAPSSTPPVIDWNKDAHKTDNSTLRISAVEPQRKWSLDFVDSLGKSTDEQNPNQRIKVTLPTVAVAAKPISSLKR